MTPSAIFALVTGLGAMLVWLVATVRVLRTPHALRAPGAVPMHLTALLASTGAAAAGFGYAQTHGLGILISPDDLTLIASMGRGALLSAGVIVLFQQRRRVA